METARPLCDFDVVGFSLQFELTYTNVLTMLDLGGIPLRSSDRGDDDPLVIAGGPTATHPEPLAAFVDAFVIGDGERATTDIALRWVESRGLPRKERIAKLGELRGVYVPSLHSTSIDPGTGFVVVDGAPIERNLLDDIDEFPFPDDGPVGGPEAIFDRMSIEIARGCTEGCRFCQAGMIYRPVRERDPEKVVETLASAVKKSGYDEVSLTSLSTADYSCIAPLIQRVTERLAPQRISLGVSSLRAYGLGENTLDDMSRIRAAGITFAPEAGSQRMRDVVNKNVTEEQLMQTAERIFSREFTSMKLYFMIGLPTEEEEDVREIVRVGKRAREVGFRIKRERGAGPPTVTVSVSTHVPKPHTPFQWCAMDHKDVVREKQGWLEEEARGARVELKMHDSDGSWLEGVFARGDRTLGDVLETAYRNGARFDSWGDQLDLPAWERAFAEHGVDPQRFLGTIPVTARLPWSHIDVGLEEGFLVSEYRKAVKSRLSPPCGKVAGAFIHATNLEEHAKEQRKLVCYDCGVACDLSAMRAQREDFLIKLRADKPREYVPRAEAPRVPKKKRGPPPRIEQGEARRYRFTFTKLGASAYLSHLDLIRALPRAFRRAGLPLFYSSGYHPKAEMTFAPALSLGVMSLGEIVDVKLTCTCEPDAWLDALSAGAPDGLRFTSGRALGPADASVSKLIDTAQYALAIPRAAMSE
ncbi:MAG TPA: TIGR03960 family B12-binding radical SAM protein, partial [Polyangiaceae bacterium]|nr:TIGR03960 family B12-binding radical SAM protein [Polyangiaceae bacterium]